MTEEFTVPELQEDPVVVSEKDLSTLEASLEKLWEKARRVSDLLLRLKDENRELKGRVQEFERQEAQWKADLRAREQELERLRAEMVRLQSNGSQAFTRVEKEELQQRVKDLIAKINARL